MKPEVVYVAITLTDGTLAVMQFVTKQQRSGDDPGWTREPSVGAVEAEVKKASERWDVKPQSWRTVSLADLPTNRATRETWRDTGTKIVEGV